MQTEKPNPKMVILARESRGLSQKELPEVAPQGTISKIEAGIMPLTKEMTASLSKALKYPKSFFYREGEIFPPVSAYRMSEGVKQKMLTEINANINIYRLNIETLLKGSVLPSLDLPKYDLEKGITPEEAARKVRRAWGVPKGTIESLTDLLESKGIIIIGFDFGTELVDCRSIITKEGQPVIFINKIMPGDRQRFSLAHELGKLVMHVFFTPAPDRRLNHEANLFAAEFLMPEKDIKADFKEKISLPALKILKPKWKASMISILYRGNTLGFVSESEKFDMRKQFNKEGYLRREPAQLDIKPEKPQLLTKLILKYKKANGYDVKELAKNLHLTEKDLESKYIL